MSEEQAKEPCGVLAIMTRCDDGHVIATAADFQRSGYGGFKLWEAQKIRARDAVKRQAVRAYCSEVLTNALESYTIERIADDLLTKRGGHKITMRSVGYLDEIAAAIEH
jgi:hypothetical protein